MALSKIKVLELAGLAPVPMCGMILADFGADVVRIDRQQVDGPGTDVLARGKRSIALNLKHEAGRQVLLSMAAAADVLLDPFRPGVLEKLGIGPNVLHRINPRLVIGRLTGFGQTGEYHKMAGHDINYIATSGALSAFGPKGSRPVFPGNVLGDFAGGGLLCAMGVMAALLERQFSGKGQVVDCAMVDGATYLSTFIFKNKDIGFWGGERGTNLLDSGAPFYDTYETQDGKYVAVGALEPQFYRLLLKGLALPQELPDQMDISRWPELRSAFAAAFKSKSRAEWAQVFDRTDACVTPVLGLAEVMHSKHNRDRGLMLPNQRQEEQGGGQQQWEPAPAPRLSRTPGDYHGGRRPDMGQHTRQVLKEYGYSDLQISQLLAQKAAFAPAAPLSKL